ncbi:AI-2E family transporter [Sphingomonas sp. LHG3443-2]|uniref:AI-2E family transporter n=1 Tax=Sphingomonas sp. LHG3443-2 TaxID=2804639 RepID=UPI003CF80A37
MQEASPLKEDSRGGFLLFLVLVTLALGYIAWPFASALLWAVVAAIMFQPLYRWMLVRTGGRNRAAIAALLVIFVAIIVPAIAIGDIIVRQALQIYEVVKAGQFDAASYFEQIQGRLPTRLNQILEGSGYGNFAVIQERVTAVLRDSLTVIASQALKIGGNAFTSLLVFAVGLYVTYFLLRDGERIGAMVKDTLPLDRRSADHLASNFVATIRATIKGSVVVGLVQGLLGTITFWIVGFPSAVLLGVLMAIVSLLPAVGPALVWVPIAAYLLLTGSIWQGIVVIVSGALVIGMADNLLRPLLVGRETGIPDWLVLVTTLGGIAAFGLSGVVVGPVVAGLFLAGWALYRDEPVEELVK